MTQKVLSISTKPNCGGLTGMRLSGRTKANQVMKRMAGMAGPMKSRGRRVARP